MAADKKPNILVIWGVDIDYSNIIAYKRGMMGSKTPNIDRIVQEGQEVRRFHACSRAGVASEGVEGLSGI